MGKIQSLCATGIKLIPGLLPAGAKPLLIKEAFKAADGRAVNVSNGRTIAGI
ncbi:MAG: hypothetical protein ACXVH6_02490 [Halobacteriota archaeon]